MTPNETIRIARKLVLMVQERARANGDYIVGNLLAELLRTSSDEQIVEVATEWARRLSERK